MHYRNNCFAPCLNSSRSMEADGLGGKGGFDGKYVKNNRKLNTDQPHAENRGNNRNLNFYFSNNPIWKLQITFNLDLLSGLQIIKVNPFPHNDTFWRPWETSFLKTLWEKDKLLVTSNFSFTHSVFYQFRKLSVIYIKLKIVVCRLFQFWPVLNFVVW